MASWSTNPALARLSAGSRGPRWWSFTNSARAAAINQRFHLGLYQACRNRFLTEAARALNNSLLLLGPTTLSGADRIETVVSQHEAIIVALQSGDPAAAGRAAEEHLETSLRYRLRTLSS